MNKIIKLTTLALITAVFSSCTKDPILAADQNKKTETTTTSTASDGELYLEEQLYPLNGFMGSNNGQSMTIDHLCTENPHSGKHCLSITFDGSESWSGNVMFASTPWKSNIGKDLSGYKRLTFWTRCNQKGLGNGQIHMGMKTNGNDFYGQFFNYTSTEWRKITITLPGTVNSTLINYLFEYSQNAPVAGSTIYLDDIRYEK
ncbi:MAG: hypothetical protein ACKOXB_15240 [Flavobacteriales bacterium]